jgi:hypothetical protein
MKNDTCKNYLNRSIFYGSFIKALLIFPPSVLKFMQPIVSNII